MSLTREEFIARAADAMLRATGNDPVRGVPAAVLMYHAEMATTALDAVAAFELYDLVQTMEPAEYPAAADVIAKAEGR